MDYYALDRRNVTPDGVHFVMQHFFEAIQNEHTLTPSDSQEIANVLERGNEKSEGNFCEEELLTAFLDKKSDDE
jgi:hypothetical protein